LVLQHWTAKPQQHDLVICAAQFVVLVTLDGLSNWDPSTVGMLNTVHGMAGGLQVASAKDVYLDARHVLSQPPGGNDTMITASTRRISDDSPADALGSLFQQLVGTLEHNIITLSGLRCTS